MDSFFFLWLISSILFIGVESSHNDLNSDQTRQKRLFSLFNIVTFKNDPCTTTGAGNLGGTCFTASECTTKGGSASGNCASGFGVCCLFVVNGACGTTQTINQNCTYIRNEGFPTADMTPGETCTYNFNRICDRMCGRADDAITVSSPFSTSANAFPPTVCGLLTGQHMYLETGTTGGTAGTLIIDKGTGAGSRSFDIKATYYTCNNLAKAPAGCTQYFTGQSGSFQSYNHAGGQFLANQNYRNCFRQELGFCRLSLSESASTTPDPFLLSDPTIAAETTCSTLNHITVMTPVSGMVCGGIFGNDGDTGPTTLTTTSGSFEVGVQGLATQVAGITGFNLDYEQVACA